MIYPSFQTPCFEENEVEYPGPRCNNGLREVNALDITMPSELFKLEIEGFDDDGRPYHYDLENHDCAVKGHFRMVMICNRSKCRSIIVA